MNALEFVRNWHVVFCDVEPAERRWWHVLVEPGKRHVLLFGYSPKADQWVAVDPLFDRIDVCLLSKQQVDEAVLGVYQGGGDILHLPTPVRRRRRLPRIPIYCVSAVMAVAQIPGLAFTPGGLYDLMIRLGAQRSFPKTRRVLHG